MAIREDWLTHRVIDRVIRVHAALGPGYSERVYRRVLMIEFRSQELDFECEKVITIHYRGEPVGRHRLDFLVGKELVVELKVAHALVQAHYSQVRSYLKSTGLQRGLLVNFAGSLADDRRVELRVSPRSPRSP